MKGFFDYVPGSSYLHRLNPLTKLLLALMICIAAFISANHLFLIMLIVLNLSIGAQAGIFTRSVMLLKGLFKLCIIIFLLQVLFIRDGNVLVKLPLNILITDGGISSALWLSFVWLRLQCPCPYAFDYKVNDLSNVLVTKLGVPYPYAFALTTRCVYILYLQMK